MSVSCSFWHQDNFCKTKLYIVGLITSGHEHLSYYILFWSLVLPADNFAVREPYDRVIRCLGFKVHMALNLIT